MSPDDLKILLSCVAILVLFLVSSGLVLLGGLVILLAALFTSTGEQFFQTLGALEPRSWTEFGLVVGGAFAILIPANYLIMALVPASSQDPFAADAMQSSRAAFALLAVSVLLAAILEEIVFRGYLLTRLSDIFGTSNGAILLTVGATSIFFGIAHYYQTGLQSALMIGLLSVVIGVIFIKTGFNLGYALAIHLLNNLFALGATRRMTGS